MPHGHPACPRFGQPDDLAWGPHARFYFFRLRQQCRELLAPDGGSACERICAARGDRGRARRDVIVAEQQTNRLLRIDPVSNGARLATIPTAAATWASTRIARDARDGSILVPNCLTASCCGSHPRGQVRVLATGLGRPVGVVALPGVQPCGG